LENQGLLKEAEAAYRKALELDPDFGIAQNNLAVLYARLGKSAEAETLLRKLTQRQPQFAEGPYQLGILLAEDPKRMPEAAESLRQAVKLAPNNSRMHYNLGLAEQHLKHPAAAEASLLAAWKLMPRSSEYLNALLHLYMEQEQWSRAATCVEELLKLHPDQQQLRLMLEQLRARAGG
jgi:Flp pilus assembly protein TadD